MACVIRSSGLVPVQLTCCTTDWFWLGGVAVDQKQYPNSGGGGGEALTLTEYTYMCLPFGKLFREIWYSDRRFHQRWRSPNYTNWMYFGQIIVKSTQFDQNWVLFFRKWYTDGWEIGQKIGIQKVRFLRSGRHIHVTQSNSTLAMDISYVWGGKRFVKNITFNVYFVCKYYFCNIKTMTHHYCSTQQCTKNINFRLLYSNSGVSNFSKLIVQLASVLTISVQSWYEHWMLWLKCHYMDPN